jgi:hypothetical protein
MHISIRPIVVSPKLFFFNFNIFIYFLPSFLDKIHRGLEMLIRTSKPAVPNKIVESNTSRSKVAIFLCMYIYYLNIILEKKEQESDLHDP